MPWPPTNSPATPYSLHVRWFSGLFVYHAVWFHGMWGVGLWAGMHREAPVSARLTVRRLWNTRSRRNAPRGMPPQVAGAYRRHAGHSRARGTPRPHRPHHPAVRTATPHTARSRRHGDTPADRPSPYRRDQDGPRRYGNSRGPIRATGRNTPGCAIRSGTPGRRMPACGSVGS